MPGGTTQRPRVVHLASLCGLLVLIAVPHVLWSCLDTRAPDDHDPYYTQAIASTVLAWPDDSSAGDRLGSIETLLGSFRCWSGTSPGGGRRRAGSPGGW